MDYVLIVSSGRSGSNRLLEMMNCHERTIARSEAEDVRGSDFNALPGPRAAMALFPGDVPEGFLEAWRQAVARSRFRQSARDPFNQPVKEYLRPAWAARAGQRVLASTRVRRRLPGIDVGEWAIPRLWFDASKADRIVPVLKVGGPAWTLCTHPADEGQRLIHAIRHPEGMLNSWWNRYVQRHGRTPEGVHRAELPRLRRVLEHYGRPVGDLETPTLPNVAEAALWAWRQANEALIVAFAGSPRYLLSHYEDVSADEVAAARRLFVHAGLDFTGAHAARLATRPRRLFGDRHRERLDPAMCAELIEKVTGDSPVRDLLVRPRPAAA